MAYDPAPACRSPKAPRVSPCAWASAAIYWQFVVWGRQFAMTIITIVPRIVALSGAVSEEDFVRGNADSLLAGQTTALPAGRLALSPRFPPPYVVPVLAAGLEGALTSRKNGSYSFAVSFGRLQLPAGGLSVDGVPYPRPVRLGAGESVAWAS